MSYKTVKDIIDLLVSNGFRPIRQKESHRIYTNGKLVVVVSVHGKKGIEKGSYYNILRQPGLK